MSNLGQTPIVKEYANQLAGLLYGPVKTGSNSLFIWPIGNAKNLHLPEILKSSYKQAELKAQSRHVEIFYFNCNEDLTATLQSFKFTLLKSFTRSSGRPTNPDYLKEFLLARSSEKDLYLIFNNIEIYSGENLKQVIAFIRQLVSLRPTRIHAQFHIRQTGNVDDLLTTISQTSLNQETIEIPLPESTHAKTIIEGIVKNSSLELDKHTTDLLFKITGPHIFLIRTAIRILLKNGTDKKTILSLNTNPEFLIKKSVLEKKNTVNSLASSNLLEITNLTKKERQIMAGFLDNPSGFLTRDQLSEIIWKEKSVEKYSSWAIDKIISRLREKIFLAGYSFGVIKTIKGKGYRYESRI